MSARGSLLDQRISSRSVNPYSRGRTIPPNSWTRHPAWLTLTAPLVTDEKFVGLHAVWPESNFIALSAAGNYTVDWGDGSVEDYNADVVAYHEYSYSDSDLDNTNGPVTFQGSADTVTRTSHGYADGQQVKFYNITTTTGISNGQVYYVRDVTTDTFKVAATAGGTAIDLVNDGTGTLLPYKQAIVQVYPQAGATLTALNLHRKHNKTKLSNYSSGFLDIAVAGPSLIDIRIGVATPGSSSANIGFRYLERVNFVKTNCRNFIYLFNNCYALAQIDGFSTNPISSPEINVTFIDSTNTVSAMGHGFNDGDPVVFTSITSPNGVGRNTLYYVISASADTFKVSTSYGGSEVNIVANGSGVAQQGPATAFMFINCYSLAVYPSAIDLSTAISTSSMFSGCVSLYSLQKEVASPLSVSTSSMFNNCTSLTKGLQFVNTASSADCQQMFRTCSNITHAPSLDLSKTTSVFEMFRGCSSMVTAANINAPLATSCGEVFNGCTNLHELPSLYAPLCTSISGIFSGCLSARRAGTLTTGTLTTSSTAFAANYLLEEAPMISTASVTDMSQMFQNCYSLRHIPAYDTSSVTNMSNMFSGCSSLERVPHFNTQNVTNMQQMFQSCIALQDVPPLNTVKVTNMSGMFNGCSSIRTIPAFNTVDVTNMTNMFLSCASLTAVPDLNTSKVTSMTNMFSGCTSLQTIGALDASAATSSSSYSSMFTNCVNLSQIKMTGFKYTFSISGCKLSAAALDELYGNLATVSSQTITVSNNHGLDADTPSIATAKGWGVTDT